MHDGVTIIRDTMIIALMTNLRVKCLYFLWFMFYLLHILLTMYRILSCPSRVVQVARQPLSENNGIMSRQGEKWDSPMSCLISKPDLSPELPPAEEPLSRSAETRTRLIPASLTMCCMIYDTKVLLLPSDIVARGADLDPTASGAPELERGLESWTALRILLPAGLLK